MEEYNKTNREKRLAPKRGNGYCQGCDRYLVPDGAKCHCGRLNKRKRLKKDES